MLVYKPVNNEKCFTAGKIDEAPAQKAMTSVSDVMVMAIPLVLIVLPMRVSTSSMWDVSAKPDNSINMSSTPIPESASFATVYRRIFIGYQFSRVYIG
jgi:hypothetical protein